MADVFNPQQRSAVMRAVKSRDTAPEMKVRRAAHALGLRFRLHRSDLPGSPDLVFPAKQTALFVHGCFWHGHKNCKYFVVPKTRTKWWMDKITRNKANDEKVVKALKKVKNVLISNLIHYLKHG